MRERSSAWWLLVVLDCYIYKTNGYQFYAVQNAYNRCALFRMTEHNHNLRACVTELHGGRNW